MKFLAGEYETRESLESIIKAELGVDLAANAVLDPQGKSLHTIEGTREELVKLALDDTTRVFSVRCIITDSPTRDRVKKK